MADDGETKLGLNAALDDMVEAVIEFKRDEQMSLLPSEATVQDVSDEATAERAGPGRPRGSKNKRTVEWTDYILNRHPSPLIFLAETYSRPVQDLAKELNCKTDDAYRIQVAAAKELAPYVHQKQPVAVEVSAKGVVQLVLEMSSGVASAVGVEHDGDGAVVIEGVVINGGDENEK